MGGRSRHVAPLRRSVTRDAPGSYTLLVALSRCIRVRVGALGSIRFQPGLYAYTGSAMGGVWARVARHLRRRKRKHWHIDYLLARREATIVGVVLAPSAARRECRVNARLLNRPGSEVTAPRFGASDCRCASHLVFLGRQS